MNQDRPHDPEHHETLHAIAFKDATADYRELYRALMAVAIKRNGHMTDECHENWV